MRCFKQLIILIFPLYIFSQDFSNQWIGHYSYFKINDTYTVNNKIYTASENAVFIYDTETNTSEVVTSVDGLSGENISVIYHSATYDITIIGYENGLVELLIDNEVRTFIDIVSKPTIPPTQKRINSFFEYQDKLFISTEFGIVEFNLERIEFGDTFFVGPGGSQINITGTVVFGDSIYASTTSNGLLVAGINNDNLVDFNQWTTVVSGNFRGVVLFNNELVVWQNNNVISSLEGVTLRTLITATSGIQDLYVDQENLVVTQLNESLVYDFNVQQISSIVSTEENPFELNTSLISNGKIYLGTETKGLLEVDRDDITQFISVTPEGPLLNSAFAIEALNDNLWVVYGEYSFSFNPFPLRRRGASRLTSEGWFNISKDEFFEATSLSSIAINPANEEQIFICSASEGLLEINNGEVTNLYNSSNSGLETFVQDAEAVRLNGALFDENNELWFLNMRVDNGLKRFSPSTKEIFNVSLNSVIPNPGSNIGFSDLALDRNGNFFLGGWNIGVVGYSQTTGTLIQLKGKGEGANLPSDYVSALQVDRNNQLWIGTNLGLRVLFNTSGVFQQANPVTEQIIILDDEGVPQELLFGQFINDIEVDGANNKWVATAASGVFYFSPDGKETLAHFTKDNSPLPDNNVVDVTVDDSTGAVYFATPRGLLEYKGTATGPENDLESIIAFPNPVRPGFNGRVTIKGLTSKANVKITDIEGNLVYEEVSEGGSIQWDTTAFGKHKVASGVYLILITGEDKAETTVSKLLIVR